MLQNNVSYFCHYVKDLILFPRTRAGIKTESLCCEKGRSERGRAWFHRLQYCPAVTGIQRNRRCPWLRVL